MNNISKILVAARIFTPVTVFIFCPKNALKSFMTFAIVAAVAVMLVASSAAVATEDAFAGTKKKKEYNQTLSQANACGNGKLPLNVFCSNSGSQIQGDESAVSVSSYQAGS